MALHLPEVQHLLQESAQTCHVGLNQPGGRSAFVVGFEARRQQVDDGEWGEQLMTDASKVSHLGLGYLVVELFLVFRFQPPLVGIGKRHDDEQHPKCIDNIGQCRLIPVRHAVDDQCGLVVVPKAVGTGSHESECVAATRNAVVDGTVESGIEHRPVVVDTIEFILVAYVLTLGDLQCRECDGDVVGTGLKGEVARCVCFARKPQRTARIHHIGDDRLVLDTIALKLRSWFHRYVSRSTTYIDHAVGIVNEYRPGHDARERTIRLGSRHDVRSSVERVILFDTLVGKYPQVVVAIGFELNNLLPAKATLLGEVGKSVSLGLRLVETKDASFTRSYPYISRSGREGEHVDGKGVERSGMRGSDFQQALVAHAAPHVAIRILDDVRHFTLEARQSFGRDGGREWLAIRVYVIVPNVKPLTGGHP